jgi:hypothetical protein
MKESTEDRTQTDWYERVAKSSDEDYEEQKRDDKESENINGGRLE